MKRCVECGCLMPDSYDSDVCEICFDEMGGASSDRIITERKSEKVLNVLSLFSGIGAFEKALTNLNIPFNLVNYCEIDKYASKSYSAIHGIPESKNLQDVTKVDFLSIDERIDLITYGFPCQDISVAGKQKGFKDENGERTRSGLFFEALRIIEEFKPKFAIAENVKALTSKKFANEFKTVLDSLDDVGYNNYYRVLNSKDYGIPQNRERVFIISIRKDIDKGFSFPKPIPLDLRLKDLLEDEVDEKYYLKSDKIQPMVNGFMISKQAPFNTMSDGTCRTIKSQYAKNSQANFIKQTDQGATAVIMPIDKSTNTPKEIEIANCITAREDRGISNRKAEETAVLEISDDIDEFLNS